MELLEALEEKISRLVAAVKQLRLEKEELATLSNSQKERIEKLEQMLMQKNEDSAQWIKEKESTQEVVDKLLSNIDALIEESGN